MQIPTSKQPLEKQLTPVKQQKKSLQRVDLNCLTTLGRIFRETWRFWGLIRLCWMICVNRQRCEDETLINWRVPLPHFRKRRRPSLMSISSIHTVLQQFLCIEDKVVQEGVITGSIFASLTTRMLRLNKVEKGNKNWKKEKWSILGVKLSKASASNGGVMKTAMSMKLRMWQVRFSVKQIQKRMELLISLSMYAMKAEKMLWILSTE